MEILAFILSVLGTVCLCIPPLIKGKNMQAILLLVFSANVFIALSYMLTGAYTGAATCSIGALQTLINFLLERKGKPIPKWLIMIYAIIFTIVNIALLKRVTDIITLLAALIFVLGICVSNGRTYRLLALINCILWITYDIATLSFGPLSTHIIQLLTTIFGILMHDIKKDNAG